jgi:hypothetical protein
VRKRQPDGGLVARGLGKARFLGVGRLLHVEHLARGGFRIHATPRRLTAPEANVEPPGDRDAPFERGPDDRKGRGGRPPATTARAAPVCVAGVPDPSVDPGRAYRPAASAQGARARGRNFPTRRSLGLIYFPPAWAAAPCGPEPRAICAKSRSDGPLKSGLPRFGGALFENSGCRSASFHRMLRP